MKQEHKANFAAVALSTVVFGVVTLYLSTNLLTPFFADLFFLTLELPKADSITWGRTAALVIPVVSASAEFIGIRASQAEPGYSQLLAILVVATRFDATP